MKERIVKILDNLNDLREETLKLYMDELENFTALNGNPKSAHRAGILHDLDKHITNLELEIRRLNAEEALGIGESLLSGVNRG